ATLSPGFPQTTGTSRSDSALGIGGRIGLIYRPIDQLQLGAMYVFRSHFQKFNRYSDLLYTGLDMPREIQAGLAGKPIPGLLLMLDYHWINWSDSGLIGDNLALGGLGWRDQHVIAFGIAYDLNPKLSFPLTVRAGYNYGRSPITPANTFRNLLIPTVVEHHITAGLSFELSEHVTLDGAYVYEPSNTVTDDGSGNPTGAGSFTGTSAHAFSVGFRGSWGKFKPIE
ncbi:MAG: outer membrane protein transport protein, partial [Deltaproteobacteria bacterium]|nr:outer membrane protein transport protein [Deltaproteobacteria bacterium]